MDLEVEALLFNTATSHDRKHFRSTLFVERSLKLDREVRIYGLLAHQVWVELEADSRVIAYNEAPVAIPIPLNGKIFKQTFKFAVRREDGTVEAISVHDEVRSHADDGHSRNPFQEHLSREEAILAWAKTQGIQYKCEMTKSVAPRSLKIANLRRMLKFVATTKNSRFPDVEQAIQNTILKLAPAPIRHVLDGLSGIDETIVIAFIARNLLS